MSETEPAIQQGVHGKKTTVGFGATFNGTFTTIGDLVKEVPMPLSERDIQEFQDNDQADPIQHSGPKKFSAIELSVAYTDKTAYDALAALDDGNTHYLKFTLQNSHYFVYRGMVNKLGPAGSFEEGFAVMTFGFKPACLSASGAPA